MAINQKYLVIDNIRIINLSQAISISASDYDSHQTPEDIVYFVFANNKDELLTCGKQYSLMNTLTTFLADSGATHLYINTHEYLGEDVVEDYCPRCGIGPAEKDQRIRPWRFSDIKLPNIFRRLK